MTPSSRLHLLAARHHWVLTRAQLLDLGLTADGIRHAVEAGRLFGLHPGVYAVGRSELSLEGRWLAAVRACGEGAVLSHIAAAKLWGVYEGAAARIDVTVPTQAGLLGPHGVALHRSDTLVRGDRTRHRRVPVTSLRRTLVDLAGVLTARQLRSALRLAERVHGLSLSALRATVDQPRTAYRVARLRTALDEWVPKVDLTESDLEQEFLVFCAAHRLPAPEPQVWFGRFRADFVWADLRLIVETDGRKYHKGDIPFQWDAGKDRALKALGFEVLRFTWAEIVNRPASVAAELRAAFKRRARELELAA
ncbi:MAG: DUF559 domain-containing protein [Solirubrobacteraceae bacterium]